MVFCNTKKDMDIIDKTLVTILILIDGFLQFLLLGRFQCLAERHNPYFNRWFSAIQALYCLIGLILGHNPYFNRWFSAIMFWNHNYVKYVKSQSLF